MFSNILLRVKMIAVYLKHSLHTTVGRYIFACIAALLLAYSTVPMRADVSDCTCDADSLIADNLSICIGGINYVVDVYGCMRIDNSYPFLAQLCSPSGDQNQYSTITRICFVGSKPLPIDPAATFGAVICALDPCKTPGVSGAWVPPVAGSIYCWTVLLPRCVQVNNATGCINKCGDGCCLIARRWARGDDGSCTLTGFWRCFSNPTNCVSPCVEVDCIEQLECC